MEQYNFSNNNIELACEKVDKFLSSLDVEHREVLRIRLTFEEVLLKYREKLGMDKKLVDFATPLGQVLFKPAYMAMLFK
ncbi:MAG: hypothetical protein IKW30_07905 [Lachnospiraceae bacterium]|nr:hypothetical protein [Lachnospiraceae bacterium]